MNKDDNLIILDISNIKTKLFVYGVIFIKNQAYRILQIVDSKAMLSRFSKDYKNKFEESGIFIREEVELYANNESN